MDYQWNTDNTVSLKPVPKKVRKLTGTRFAAVLGMDKWNTPFATWCEVTGAYRVPFEDTVYTLAGKAIEPKQIQYMRDSYAMSDELVEPKDIWGEDYFKQTWGNFFSHDVFGGMWDALLVSDDWDKTESGLVGHVDTVLEFKTTKRAEDWADDVPEHYALQAALYAYLLDCNDVIMVCSFLQDSDYDSPENFEPSVDNTITVEFSLSDRYPTFEDDYIKPAVAWWEEHVLKGTSPEFDERKDADYLKPMRNASLNPDSDVDALMEELAKLNDKVSTVESTIEVDMKRIKSLKAQLKKYAEEQIGDKDTASFAHAGVTCKLAKTVSRKVDEDALEKDGLLEKYSTETESSRFTVTFAKKD